MTARSPNQILHQTQANAWTGLSYQPALLNLARWNTTKLLAILYLQDIFWLILSRLQIHFYNEFYHVAPFDDVTFLSFVTIAIFFFLVGAASVLFVRPLKKIYVPRRFISAFICFSIFMNLLMLVVLQDNARYTSGALTGMAGVIYGIGRAATFASMILFVRHKNAENPIKSKALLYGLIGSFALTIDGLANALTLMVFIFLMLPRISGKNIALLIFLAVTGSALLWIGITAKWSTIPDYVTPVFLIRWTIARFSVQAEQMFIFLSGESMIGNIISYLDLIIRSISDRFDIVFGLPLQIEYPRSVSEAIYYDIRGYYGAGSSPGILMSTALQGPFFFVVPIFYAYIFFQMFYGSRHNVTFLQLCAWQFLLKALHTNFSEYLTIVSPTLVMFTLFVVACLFTAKRADYIK